MKVSSKVLLLSFFLGVASCTQVDQVSVPQAPVPQAPVPQAPVIQENLGEQVARHINERYRDVRENCGSPSQPSFLCNGVMIRGTAKNPTFHVWNNSPAAIKRGGVSFSYLRRDDNFRRFGRDYTSGYIFQSYSHVPAKLHPEVLCSFVLDGWTDGRAESGCGLYTGRPTSAPCHTVNVLTAAQWSTHYNALTGNKETGQCGFDVRDDRNTLAGPAFDASIKARVYLNGTATSERHNELVVKAWADNLGKTLPLEAFFYRYGTDGLRDAQRNQKDLKTTDGILIPIISIRLARNETEAATFYFLPEDQTEPMPPVRR